MRSFLKYHIFYWQAGYGAGEGREGFVRETEIMHQD